jgi:3-keto-5-aminohexanoate cleavage enzyme
MDKLIIEVALNETVRREQNSHVPITPAEIAHDAYDCFNAGATIVHFHPRDPATGVARPDDTALYIEALDRIREKCDLIFYPTYGGRETVEQGFPHVRELTMRAEAPLESHLFFVGSVNMGRYDASQRAFVSDNVSYMLHAEAESFLRFCLETGLKPQIGVKELGHLRHVFAFRELGLLKDPVVCHLFFSDTAPYGPLPDAQGLLAYLGMVPPGTPFQWFVQNYGASHHRLNALAVAMGGHARTGIGDLPQGGAAPETNAQMVERVVRAARDTGREVASTAEAREILGIAQR